jgi:hypothetical protein
MSARQMPGAARFQTPPRPRRSAGDAAADELGAYARQVPADAPRTLTDLPLALRRPSGPPRARRRAVDPCAVLGCLATHGHAGACPSPFRRQGS